MQQFLRFGIIVLVFGTSLASAPAADSVAVRVATGKGVQWLQANFDKIPHSRRALAALAMYKGGVPKNSNEIQSVLEETLKRFEGGKYKPGGEHIYEAGVEATLLADFDAKKYRQELTMIRDYLVGQQRATGAWDYPTGRDQTNGDTSVTQYGCLGLWAVARAGIEVDPGVWEKILNWHVRFQSRDGGFTYVPGFDDIGGYGGKSTLNMSANAVGNIHIAMLQLDPTFLPLKEDKPKKKSVEEGPDKSKFGILQKVEVDVQNDNAKKTSGSISPASINSVRRAFNFVATRFRADNAESNHRSYFYYSLERMAALADVQHVGNHDWFNECADFVIKNQQKDGSWAMSRHLSEVDDTCFCVLFLTRSTGKLLHRTIEPKVGDGILAGGRGLPDDLSDVDFNGRQVMGKEPPKEPLDKLLASLQNTGDIDLETVQEQIVEQVQLGDRKELIGQIDRLVKLIDHPDANIRRTAVWAIGRTNNMQLAQHLISALNDKDLGVIIEARNALCWLSRKPRGFGFAEDPLEELPPDATAQQKKDAIADWHKNVFLAWSQWYLRNRPFAERGDDFEARLRANIDLVKEGGTVR